MCGGSLRLPTPTAMAAAALLTGAAVPPAALPPLPFFPLPPSLPADKGEQERSSPEMVKQVGLLCIYQCKGLDMRQGRDREWTLEQKGH